MKNSRKLPWRKRLTRPWTARDRLATRVRKGAGAAEDGKAGNGLEQSAEGDPLNGKSSDGKSPDGRRFEAGWR